MLIATLPPIYCDELAEKIAVEPLVDVLRYNVGMDSPYAPTETLHQMAGLAEAYGKKLWVDLKGRQLRIKEWVVPGYSEIILNHEVKVAGKAKVHFRGSGWTDLKCAIKDSIYVYPLPPSALGRGQSVNIVSVDADGEVAVSGYLTEVDKKFIRAATTMRVDGLMLSYTEQMSDITDVLEIWQAANPVAPNLILKIESAKGLDFIRSLYEPDNPIPQGVNIVPMLARDDLMNELGSAAAVIRAASDLINLDPDAIAASRLFSNLEQSGKASVADFADLHLLHQQGYGCFTLSDGLCLKQFDAAIKALAEYYSYYPKTIPNQEEMTDD